MEEEETIRYMFLDVITVQANWVQEAVPAV